MGRVELQTSPEGTMKPISKFVLWLLLSCLLAFGAKAQEASGHETPAHEVKASQALICGSIENAQAFATENADLARALAAVSDSPDTSSRCLVAPIAYIEGKQINRIERSDGTYSVTEITVVGVATPVGMLAIEPSVVYTILKVHEEAA
jgi:hypothetical protein